MAPKSPPYDVGDAIIMLSEFINSEGNLDDPLTVTLELVCPDGETFTFAQPDIIKDAVGKYHYRYIINNGYGYYYSTWRGEGQVDVVREKRFPVRKPFTTRSG